MRYYRYGNYNRKNDLETKEKNTELPLGRYGELIIDEDTIYEIDQECIRCKEKMQQKDN